MAVDLNHLLIVFMVVMMNANDKRKEEEGNVCFAFQLFLNHLILTFGYIFSTCRTFIN